MATKSNPRRLPGHLKHFGPLPTVAGYRIDPTSPIHQLAAKRISGGRDLKIIITAKDSQTGVGKTTAAGWLALNWNLLFAKEPWEAEKHGTLHPGEYFDIVSKVGRDYPAGTCVIVDDAEELDARRSMQNLNVKFSQRWMLMRLKQAITIITLPSPSAIDTRLEELADIWINIERRGRGLIHDIRVGSYGARNVMTEKRHKFEWPNVASHPELKHLRSMKVDKMDEWDGFGEDAEEEEEVDPDELKRQEKIRIAQNIRNNGATIAEVSDAVDMSQGWVSNNTEHPE